MEDTGVGHIGSIKEYYRRYCRNCQDKVIDIFLENVYNNQSRSSDGYYL